MRFKEELEQTRQIFGPIPRKFGLTRKFYLKIKPPKWMPGYIKKHGGTIHKTLYKFYNDQNLLYTHGEVVWGYLVSFNSSLLKKGKFDHPGSIVYSFNKEIATDPRILVSIANKILKLDKDNPNLELQTFAKELKDFSRPEIKKVIPKTLSGEIEVNYSNLMIIRKHLPGKTVKGLLVPVLVAPDYTNFCMILPSKYWSKELVLYWKNIINAIEKNRAGLNHYSNKDYTSSFKYFEQAISINQLDYAFYQNLALANFLASFIDKAKEQFKNALELNPWSRVSLQFMARISLKYKQQEEGLIYFKKALKYNYNLLASYTYYFQILLDLKNYSEIIDSIVEYLPSIEKITEADRAFIYNFWGLAYLRLEKYETALEKFKQAIALNDKVGVFTANCGYTLLKMERFEESTEYYDKTLNLDPKNLLAMNNYTNTLFKQGKMDDVLKKAEEIHKLDPKFWHVCLPWINALNILGKYNESVSIGEKFILNIPKDDLKNSATFLNYYGVALTQMKQYVQALEIFRQAIEYDPEYILAQENIAGVYLILDKDEDCNIHYHKALDLAVKINSDQERINIYINWIRGLVQKNKLDEIKEKVNLILELDPNNSMAYNFLGLVESKKNNLPKAIELYKKSFDLDPNFTLGYANYIHEVGSSGDIEEAKHIYERTLEMKLEDERIDKSYALLLLKNREYEEASKVFEKITQKVPGELINHLDLISCLINLKNYELALEKVKTQLKKFPKSVELYFFWGRIKLLTKEYDQCIEKLEFVIKMTPQYSLAYENLGIAYLELKQYDRALENFNKLREMEELNPHVYYNLAITNISMKNFEQARVFFDQATIWPKFSKAYIDYASMLNLLGSFNEIILLIKSVIKSEPDNCIYHNLLGVAYLNLNLFKEAEIFLNKSIENNPNYEMPYFNLGNLYAVGGDYSKSEEYLKKATDLAPENGKIRYHYGLTLFESKKNNEAIKEFDECLKLKPNLWEALYFKGRILLDQNENVEAIKNFKQSTEIKDDFSFSYYYWSVALEKLGNQEEAKAILQKAINLNPESENLLRKPETPWYLYG